MEEEREGAEKGAERGQRLVPGNKKERGGDGWGRREVGKAHFVKGKTVNVHRGCT